MTYRTRTLLKVSVGLVMVGVMALFAYFGMYRQEKNSKREKQEAKLALNLMKEKVVKVELVTPKSPPCVVERRAPDNTGLPTWHMLAPVETEADSITINSLLGVLERMDAERRIDIPEDDPLEKFGLAKPRLRWIVFLEDGSKKELMVGKRSQFDNQLYVMVAGQGKVLLVKGYLEESLMKTTFDLRQKRLLRFESSRVKGIVISKSGGESRKRGEIELLKRNGRWMIVKPLKARADEKEVQKIINDLENVRAKAFPSGDAGLSPYGLEPPLLRVTVEMDKSKKDKAAGSFDLEMGYGTLKSNKEMVFARLSNPPGPLARISTYHLHVLDTGVEHLRFRKLLDLDISDVARIKIDGKGGLRVLERSDAINDEDGHTEKNGRDYTWSFVSPVAKPAKTYKVQSVLSALSKLKATRIGPEADEKSLKKHGLDSPEETVTLFDEDGKVLGSLKIASSGKDGTWVLGDARKNICLVPSGTFSSLLSELTSLPTD